MDGFGSYGSSRFELKQPSPHSVFMERAILICKTSVKSKESLQHFLVLLNISDNNMTAAHQLITWQNMAAVPSEPWQFTVPNGIKQRYFIVIIKDKGVYQYDFNINGWNKYNSIGKVPDDSNTNDYYFMSSAIDINSKTLYFLNSKKSIIHSQINQNKKNKWNITKTPIKIGVGSQCVIIKDGLHIIGGSNNNKDFGYNQKLNKFDVMHSFKGFEDGFCYHRIVSVNNNIFVFGGYDTWNDEVLDTIHRYNIGDNLWHKLNVSLPKQLESFGCCTAINNQYILIFGGVDNIDECDEIYIFSLLNQEFTASKIKCPQKGHFQAIRIGDKLKDEMAVFGYIRCQWILSEISDHYFPPVYLLQLIHSYYLNEYIHLIHIDDGKHWKMSSLDIVKSDSEINDVP